MGLFVRPHRGQAHCIDCGKLLSLGSNKPGKQTVHGLKLQVCGSSISATRPVPVTDDAYPYP